MSKNTKKTNKDTGASRRKAFAQEVRQAFSAVRTGLGRAQIKESQPEPTLEVVQARLEAIQSDFIQLYKDLPYETRLGDVIAPAEAAVRNLAVLAGRLEGIRACSRADQALQRRLGLSGMHPAPRPACCACCAFHRAARPAAGETRPASLHPSRAE